MKITSMTIRMEEEDFQLYEKVLENLGWEKVVSRVYRKKFDDTEVELREYLPAFSNHLELVASFHNPKGCSVDIINQILKELKNADITPDSKK